MELIIILIFIVINSIAITVYLQNKYNRIFENLLADQERLRAMIIKQFQTYSQKDK